MDTSQSHSTLSLVSWNVAGRVQRMRERLDAIGSFAPDILALQEVTAATLPSYREGLHGLGLHHIADSLMLAASARKLTGPRKYCEMLASRWPLDELPPAEFEIPWPERVLSAIVHAPDGDIEVHVAHLPTGVGHGWTKIETFEGIVERLACPPDMPRILCGDFNSPQAENDGEIITWGQEVGPGRRGVPQPPCGRWDSGERSVLEGLANHDLADVFRRLHPQDEEHSWVWRGRGKGGASKTVRRRFDHIFASESLGAIDCHYVHDVRKAGLSDHSAIVAEFVPQRG